MHPSITTSDLTRLKTGGARRARLSAWFWGAYGWCYDAIAELAPYRDLLAEVSSHVPPHATAIFDAGCGTGNVLRALRKNRPHASLVGMDFSSQMLQRAHAKVPQARLSRGDLDARLPFPDASFDAVTCVNVIYAVAEPERTLAEFRRILKPDGVIVITSPAAQFSVMTILAAHLRRTGGRRNLLLVLRLILVGAFNFLILRRARQGTFRFLNHSAAERLVGGPVKPSYAGQNWFAVIPRARETAAQSLSS